MSEYREFRRVNGLSCPPHGFQFIAWAIVLYFTILFYTTIIPQVIKPIQISFGIATSLPLVAHYVAHILATALDPADINLRNKQKAEGIKPVPKLDKDVHKHVIENYFCNLCEIKISNNETKHCSTCNKCIQDFDHHCKWLNNCVGSRNYRLFIVTLITAAVGLVFILCLVVMMVIAYFLDSKTGRVLQPYSDYMKTADNYTNQTLALPQTISAGDMYGTGLFKVVFIPCSDLALLLILLISCVLAIVGLVLLFQLLDFHLYLYKRGMSTYDYIMGTKSDTFADNAGGDPHSVPSPASEPFSQTPRDDGAILSPSATVAEGDGQPQRREKSSLKTKRNSIAPTPHSVRWEDERQQQQAQPNCLGRSGDGGGTGGYQEMPDVKYSAGAADVRPKPLSLAPLSPPYRPLAESPGDAPTSAVPTVTTTTTGGGGGIGKKRRKRRRQRPLPELPPLMALGAVPVGPPAVTPGGLATIPDGQGAVSITELRVLRPPAPVVIANGGHETDEDLLGGSSNLADIPLESSSSLTFASVKSAGSWNGNGNGNGSVLASNSSLQSPAVTYGPRERRAEIRQALGIPMLELGDLASSNPRLS